MKTRQSGISLIGVLFWGALLGTAVLVAMKVTPAVSEYMGIKRAVYRTKDAETAAEAREIFTKQAIIDSVDSISAKDLQFNKDSNGHLVTAFAYSKKIPLVGSVSLMIDFSGNSKNAP